MKKETKQFIKYSIIAIFSMMLVVLAIAMDYNNNRNQHIYKTENEQHYYDYGYSTGYLDGYDIAKSNLTYGVVPERFNFSYAKGKNYSEQITKCIKT